MTNSSSPTHILESSGFRVGCLDIPSFDLGPGEIVKLVVPVDCAEQTDQLMNAFCAKADEHMHIDGRIVALKRPMTRSVLREFFHRQTAAEWLIARCGMSREDATLRLTQVGVNPAAPVSTLAGNPRWLIGFVAAIFQRPAAVVFTTTGCDPVGIRQALATASERLADACGVYFTRFPDVGVREPDYAAVLNLVVREPEPVT